MGSLRTLKVWLAGAALTLIGCNKLLGDFKYDPSFTPPTGGGGGPSADEQGNIVILPAAGLVTTERGGKATFTVSLKVKPTTSVAIALSSSNLNEGTVSPASVSFTPENYDAPQTVQVTGVDDMLEDKTQSYTIRTSPATSEDPQYFNVDPLDVQVKNIDDETAGVTLIPPSGLLTTESGGEALLGIVLNHAPTADVKIPLSSDNMAEGLVSPTELVFTPDNWMAPQMVTITGVDDGNVVDGLQTYHVVTAPASSTDTGYNGLDADDAVVENQDNDTAGITLSPATGLMTRESGEMATFGIALNSPPRADVLIRLQSNDTAEGTVWPESVVFTPLNWMAPQLITVTGVNDDRADGNQPYLIVTSPAESADAGYNGLKGPDASITNVDDDSPGLTVIPSIGLITREDGESTAFSVVLNSKPRGNVVLDVTSSNKAEGTVSPAQLTFTEVSWAAPQYVTITGVDDKVADGMQPYTVQVIPSMTTADAAYAMVLPVDVQVSNTDDDSPGITVTAKPLLTTREWGDSDTFTVVLNSQPTAPVSIALTSSDTTEGTVSPTQLVFTPENWSAPQLVTVKGVNDDMQDGAQRYKIITEDAVSEDALYQGLVAPNVDVSNIDGDTAGFTVNAANNLTTSENATTATFQVFLNTEPNDDVTIPLSSSDAGEGTVSPAKLVFTRANWRAPQTVTARGVEDDGTADNDREYRIVLGPASSNDGNYNLKDPPDVTVINLDNDKPGILLRNQNNLQTREDGTAATFQIVLQSRPAQSVSIALSSTKTAEGTVTPAMITFTRDNWSAPQNVTVKGVDDNVADGDQPYRITTAAAMSQDPKYNGIDVADVSVTNLDNDSPGIIVTTPTGGVVTKEPAGPATFTIQLKSQPTADVTIPLRSTDTTEATVSPASVTFTAANWNSPRTITLTGVNDNVADGPQPYSVVLEPASSPDSKYQGLDGADVPASNLDDDSPRITVSAVTNNTTEAGMSASFTIVLGSEPKSSVTVPVTSLNTREGTVSPTSVTFTPANWNAPQKITITPVDEKVQDGDQVYTIDVGAATSQDTGYADIDPADVTLTNIDNDSAGVLVSAVVGDTTEAGGSTTFTIVLTSQPTASVSIPVASSDAGEGTTNVSMVTFSTTDYASAKTVTITGVDDEEADGIQPYSIVIGAAMSLDPNYLMKDAPDVAVRNVDDDTAGFTVTPRVGVTGEKATASTFTFTVKLTSKPTANVTIPVSSSDLTEGTVSTASLLFTPMNWNAVQSVTVTGVNDDEQDGDQDYSIVLGAATSTDPGYSLENPPGVAMSNIDDDTAGVDISAPSGPTTETGETATFTVVLRSKPMGTVTIPISSSDKTEGTVTPSSLTFTAANWNVAQTVTVHGEDDNHQQDGDQAYQVILGVITSVDANYDGKNPDDVSMVNIDDDMAGVQVSMISGPTTEAGGTATFTIVLNSAPTGSVRIPVSSDDATEGEPSTMEVVFTVDNWSDPQTVTVTGQDDAAADGDQMYTIELAQPVTADPNYSLLDPNDVQLTNTDDEPPVME